MGGKLEKSMPLPLHHLRMASRHALIILHCSPQCCQDVAFLGTNGKGSLRLRIVLLTDGSRVR